MKNEQDIYDILSPKFEDREVPFNAEHWKSMKTMIDASRATNKRTVWLMVSLCLLLLAGGTVAVYNWSGGTGKSNTLSAVSSVSNSQSPVTISSPQNLNAPSAVETSNSKIASNNSQQNTPINETIAKKQSSSNKLGITKALANNSQHQNSYERIKHNKNIATPGSQTIVSNNIASSGNVAQSNNTLSTGQNNNATSTQQRNITPGTQPNNGVQTVQQNSTIQSTKQNSIATGKHATESNVVISHKPIIGSPTIVHKTDSVAESLPKRFSDEPRIFRGKTDIFSVELGAEYSFGWQIGSVVQGKGFNPIIGVGYARYIGHKIFLKAGLQLNIFGNMSSLPYTYQHSVGNEVYDSAITTKQLYFLRIPVQLEYSIGNQKRSSIGLGGSAWVLLGNSGFASTYQQVDNNPPVNVLQYSQNAPLNGYTKVNASAFGLYRYTFTHHFSMYGIFYIEMNSMKNNSFFGGNIIERTNGIQVIASYSLN